MILVIELTHIPLEWRLFIELLKLSLNAVLLCKGTTYLPFSTLAKGSMKISNSHVSGIQKVQMAYMYGDLNTIGLLLGTQTPTLFYCLFY